MKINIITIFPELFDSFFKVGVVGRAVQSKLVEVNFINPRDYTSDKHQSVDSSPYGGGDGMLLKFDPLKRAIQSLKESNSLGHVVSLSPQGKTWQDSMAKDFFQSNKVLTIVCGRYAGIDQRFVNEYVDQEISIGDYILSGAEIAAQVIIDSSLRFVSGVLGHPDSAELESFNNSLLEAPQYTKPSEIDGLNVPEVLISGHHKNIIEWKSNVSIVKTYLQRMDLIDKSGLDIKEIKQAFDYVTKLSEKELSAIGLSLVEIQEVKL